MKSIILITFVLVLSIYLFITEDFVSDKNTFYIISIKDDKYNINIEGDIDNKNKIQINIPYKIDPLIKIDLDAYEQTILLDGKYSRENEFNSKLTFYYPKQIGLTGNGYIKAFLRIDDVNSNLYDNKFKTKQLQIDKDDEYLLAKFTYPTNRYQNKKGSLEIKVISGIKDKMYNVNNAHNFIYYPIQSTTTGRWWLNNNLGADYSNIIYWKENPLQQAENIFDEKAYGNLFQWGRNADGHEFRNGVEQTNIKSDNPDNNLYIISTKFPFDWRINQNDNLWNENNVCPNGWRLPSKIEFEDELKDSSNIYDNLKLTMAGYRLKDENTIFSENLYGNYWLKDVKDSYAGFLIFHNHNASVKFMYKSAGFSIRCIKN